MSELIRCKTCGAYLGIIGIYPGWERELQCEECGWKESVEYRAALAEQANAVCVRCGAPPLIPRKWLVKIPLCDACREVEYGLVKSMRPPAKEER